MVGAVLFAETTSLRVESTPLVCRGRGVRAAVPRSDRTPPKSATSCRLGALFLGGPDGGGRRRSRRNPGARLPHPAARVSEGFDVVRRRRQPAQKVSAGLCKRRHRAETTRSGANRQRRASRRAWAKADESHTFVGVARCVSCNSQCGPRRLGESRASRR